MRLPRIFLSLSPRRGRHNARVNRLKGLRMRLATKSVAPSRGLKSARDTTDPPAHADGKQTSAPFWGLKNRCHLRSIPSPQARTPRVETGVTLSQKVSRPSKDSIQNPKSKIDTRSSKPGKQASHSRQFPRASSILWCGRLGCMCRRDARTTSSPTSRAALSRSVI